MRITDVDFRAIVNDWDRADIIYLRSICDEKLAQIDAGPLKRRTVVRSIG